MRSICASANPAAASSAQRGRVGEAARSIAGERREVRVQEEPLEVLRGEGRDREPPARPEHARELAPARGRGRRACGRPGACARRRTSRRGTAGARRALPPADARAPRAARARAQHLGRGVDPPHACAEPRACRLPQRGRCRSRCRAAGGSRQAGDRVLRQLAPTPPRPAATVVVGGERVEVQAHPAGAGAGSAAARPVLPAAPGAGRRVRAAAARWCRSRAGRRCRRTRHRLGGDLAAEVAGREMRQREHRPRRHARLAPPAAPSCGLSRRRGRAPPPGTSPRARAGRRPIAASNSVRHGRVSPEKTIRRPGRAGPRPRRDDRRAGVERHRLAVLEPTEQRPLGDTQPAGRGEVEAPGPLVLDQRIAEALDAVVGRERDDAVAVGSAVAGTQLGELRP